MRSAPLLRTALSVAAMSFVLASAAHAASSRTYVANLGSDSNTSSNCGHTAPCATFAAAYGVTSSGGEIVALDVAGYGPLNITGPLTVTGIVGALVNVTTGTTGINITAGAGNNVILRNVLIGGAAGSSNTTGISLNTGNLIIYNSVVKQVTTGLVVTSTHADVVNTDFIGNATAVQTNGIGAFIIGSSLVGGTTLVRINAGNMNGNTIVFTENNPSSSGGTSSATVFIFQPGTNFSTNITGYATLMTITGTGGSNPGPQPYSSNTATPN
jgi:hypothetical protein